MKKKIAAIIAACVAPVFVAAGCNTKTYEIFTNIPADGYKITSRQFVLSQVIEGFSESEAAASGAKNSDFKTAHTTFYGIMNTDAALYISADFNEATTQKYSALCAQIADVLTDINNSLSITVEGSSVWNFNAAEAGVEVEIDKTAYDILTLAQEVYTLTSGFYNPAVYYSVQAYGFDGNYNYPKTAAQLPDDEEISKYKTLSGGFGEIELYESGGEYFAKKPENTVQIGGKTCSLKIDLGGIGKGFAADEVNALIEESGFNYGYFTFAQSSIAFKKYFNGAGNYTLQLKNPRNRVYTYIDIPVQDVCVSTSGDYEQSYTLGGVRYCHIINPKTGKPVQTGIMSATVIGDSAAKADALSTAIMAMGKDAAIEFIKTALCDYRVIFTCDGAAKVENVA